MAKALDSSIWVREVQPISASEKKVMAKLQIQRIRAPLTTKIKVVPQLGQRHAGGTHTPWSTDTAQQR